MKKSLLAVAFAASLAAAAPASAQNIEADPFAADQSLAILAGLGTAGTVAAVVVAVVVAGVIAEIINDDEEATATSTTTTN